MLARGLPRANEQYFEVGRSAIEVIVAAMIAAEKTEIATVLDLPCGGGRVTRHLMALFPDAELFVGDLDRACESSLPKSSAREWLSLRSISSEHLNGNSISFLSDHLLHILMRLNSSALCAGLSPHSRRTDFWS